MGENLGFDVPDCLTAVEHSPYMQAFRALLFSRIVPCVRDIGLWGERVQKAYSDMGVLEMAGVKLDDLMRSDEEIAERLDRERRFAAEEQVRRAEVEQTITDGAVT